MAKFAQYYLTYDKNNDMFADLDFAQRQQYFGELYDTADSIEFTVGDKTYPHRIYHHSLQPKIIVMRLANIKEILIEKDFHPETVEHNPSCFVVIDNRDNCRRIAIQKLQSSFSSTDQVAHIIQKVIGDRLLADHNYTIKLNPQRYPEDLYKLWRMQQHHTAGLKFNISYQEAEQLQQDTIPVDDTLMGHIMGLAEESRKAKYRQSLEVTPAEKGAVMCVDESSSYIRNLVRYSARTGTTIELLTNDGGTFQCYVDSDSESTDKFVTSTLETEVLELLFEERDKDGNPIEPDVRKKAEEALLEFVNGMKYMVDEREKPLQGEEAGS